MCGRYTLYESGKLAGRFRTADSAFKLEDSYNVAPGQYMPVIIQSELGRTVELMKWGLVPSWAKDTKIGYKMINARADTIFDKPAWRGPIKYRRCLVPAHGFYEWQRLDAKTKHPYFIHPTDQELFAFAGVYETWHDRMTGSELWTFSIVTTEANRDMEGIHDRMPVILSPDEEADWLDPANQTRETIEPMLHPYPDGHITMHQVSTVVNTPKNNDKRLIYPIDESAE
jgi:putative SOS response-associated peptidase YedK